MGLIAEKGVLNVTGTDYDDEAEFCVGWQVDEAKTTVVSPWCKSVPFTWRSWRPPERPPSERSAVPTGVPTSPGR